jgi:hypothetical protein
MQGLLRGQLTKTVASVGPPLNPGTFSLLLVSRKGLSSFSRAIGTVAIMQTYLEAELQDPITEITIIS